MMGYFKDEALTKEAIKEGYFHTGDIGKIDSEGFLKITDRKKEMFKTSGGKYISPQLLENAMKQSRFIEQIMVIGEGQKMPAAFIQPNFEFVREWEKIHGITVGTTNEEIISNPKNIIAIEWPEKIKKIVPKNTIKINFKFIDEKTREVFFKI